MYVSSNPRVVKEADTLAEAGFRVRVVFSQGNLEQLRRHDDLLLSDRRWTWTVVRWSQSRRGERRVYWPATCRYQVSRRLPRSFWAVPGVAERGLERIYPELAKSAAAEQADIYIGHNPAGLAAAAHAANKWNAILAYDVEDFHTGEHPPSREGRRLTDNVDKLERRYVPRCTYLSAASPGIASALATRYNIPAPEIVYNTFPWADRARLDGRTLDRKSDELSLYWFSQTIGPGRGIEDAIEACGHLKTGFHLHLRGAISSHFQHELVDKASGLGFANRLHFHPQVPSDAVLSRAAEHDVGLALELPNTVNHDVCQSNKIFLYLLAGVAVVATDTMGQREVMRTCPSAGMLIPPNDAVTLGNSLRLLQNQPDLLRRHKEGALNAARQTWNWERSSHVLVSSVRTALGLL